MDHRWDDRVKQDRIDRTERERYGGPRIERDDAVTRRDRLARAPRPAAGNFSQWEIGARHWDQRDLYTRDAQIEDDGYGRGPAVHPDVGSYAYHRDAPPPPSARRFGEGGPTLYEREAWPWLNYGDHRAWRGKPPLWVRVKERMFGGRGPKNWQRSSEQIHEDACEALAEHGELDATDIEVVVEGAEVTLNGTVPNRRSKRLAERIVEGVHGVDDVHNRLEIRRHDDTNDADVAFVMPARALG